MPAQPGLIHAGGIGGERARREGTMKYYIYSDRHPQPDLFAIDQSPFKHSSTGKRKFKRKCFCASVVVSPKEGKEWLPSVRCFQRSREYINNST